MLKLEVAIPAPGMDFDFNEARPLPFLSAPSTPKRFGDYTISAPTSPSRMAEFYSYFDSMMDGSEERNEVPFHWEEKPGTPRSPIATTNSSNEDDFAFDFCAEQEKASLSADELFDGGKIRPLKPPPRLQVEDYARRSALSSPRSPRSPIQRGKKIISEALSPRRKKYSDPFATAVENTRKGTENERGRERASGLKSSSSRRATRSQSPIRISENPWEEEEKQLQKITKLSAPNSKASISSNSSASKSSSKKWRLTDFLFRSASEGRAHDKDHIRKYSALSRKHEDGKDTSFRSTDSSGSVSSRRKGPVSAHELHYTVNKAVSENLKKKTFLPYKQGIFGRLAFNPAAHALANGFGNLTR